MREPFCRARACVTTLLLLKVLVGITIILVALFYHHRLAGYLPSKERKSLTGQLFNIYALGAQFIVTYLCSLAMWKRIWSRRYTPNIQLLLSIWMFFCFLIVLCGFGTIWTLFTCADTTTITTESSLIRGIDLYYTCPEWKLLWDSLQYHKECCGVNEYKDWMKASWMPKQAEKDDLCAASLNDDLSENNGGWEHRKRSSDTALAPYACCKHSCTTCYQNYMPRNSTSNPPYLNLNQINTKGCLPQFVSSLWHFIYALLILVIFAFKFDVILCLITKMTIIKAQDEEEMQGNINAASLTEDGRPQVVVKFPPNVRLMAVEEHEEDVSERCEGGEEIVLETCACCRNCMGAHSKRLPGMCSTSCDYPNEILH